MSVRAKQIVLILIGISSAFVSGCSKNHDVVSTMNNTETIDITSNNSDAVSWIKTSEKIVNSDSNVCFMPNEIIPILSQGDVRGYMKVNWVQRLGIWDYNNVSACIAGVKSSYTINTHIDFTGTVGAAQNLVLTVSPYLVDSTGEVLGTPCCVGWSGFSQTAQFYDNTTEVDIEFGVQPETLNEDNLNLKFEISDNLGNVYDDIYLSTEYLVTAEEGVSLVTDGRKKINAINGGVFEIGVDNVTLNETFNNYDDPENTVPTMYDRFYDISYYVNYVTAPKNAREDLLFDSNSNNDLRTQFVIGVNSDVDGSIVYRGDDSAYRRIYSDEYDTEQYTSTKFPNIATGESASFLINRLLPDSTGVPTYVRMYFEFPEEADARSLEEMKDFDGRFLVIQVPVSERVLPTLEEVEEAAEAEMLLQEEQEEVISSEET